ncbi:hypothetical protein F5Y10DRAFT_282293 [Nemania abortiva]|nr:hypothetical protein F5Y10DRAFT_282293 [Nemania abortiva]
MSKDQSQGPRTEAPPARQLPIRRSIGNWNLIVIFGGVVLTLAAVGCLVFLWAGEGPVPGGSQATHLWRDITLNGRSAESVTLIALVLRLVSGSQAGICTALVAAFIIERRRFPLSQMALLSIARANTNGEPRQLLQFLLLSRLNSLVRNLEVALLFLLGMTALGIQFSSTILISDFATSSLVRYANSTVLNVAVSSGTSNAIKLGTTEVNMGSTMFLFGDTDSSIDPMPDDFGVTDTGKRQRALIPLNQEDRVHLQHFSGPAFTMITRTRCMRPFMTAKLFKEEGDGGAIEVTIDYNQTYTHASIPLYDTCYPSTGAEGDVNLCLSQSFTCTLPMKNPLLNNNETDALWYTALCHLPLYNGSDVAHVIPKWDSQDPLKPSSGSWPQMTFATNLPMSFWTRLNHSESIAVSSAAFYGEWASFEIEGSFLNASLCFIGVDSSLSLLTLTGKINQKEPTLSWNDETHSIEVGPLQDLLGANTNQTPISERGALEIIGDVQNPAPLSSFDVDTNLAQDAIDENRVVISSVPATEEVFYSGNLSIGVCYHCTISGPSVPDDIATFFQQVIGVTGRAAVAIDGYFFLIAKGGYYYVFPYFDVPGKVNLTFSTEVQRPVRWRGLSTVVVLVAINSSAALAIVILYIMGGRRTIIGNFWHAASLLASEDPISILHDGAKLTDTEISQLLRSNDCLQQTDASAEDGTLQLVRCN